MFVDKVVRTAVLLVFCLFLTIQSQGGLLWAKSAAAGESTGGKSKIIMASQSSEEIESREMPSASGYVLGAGDRLRISVFGEPDLSDTYSISGEGIISFPLVGEINASGIGVRQLEDALEKNLRDGFLRNPSVSIEIDSHRPFYIMGEVRNPGSYDYVIDMSVLKAVAMAGGFTYRANRNYVEILRRQGQGMTALKKIDIETIAQPGDIILVKERFF